MKFPRIFQTEKKANPIGAVLVTGSGSEPPKWNARAFYDEGYLKNPVIYMCVEEIAKAIAGLKIEVWRGDDALEDHAIIDLLRQPNPTMSGNALIKAMFVDYLISGEMSCVQYPLGGRAVEMWHIDPRGVTVNAGSGGIASGYVYEKNGKKTTFPMTGGTTPRADLFFYKRYNPEDYWRGMSPMVAAAVAGDTHNAGMVWNYSLLKNGAKPSGAFVYDEAPDEESQSRLREWIDTMLSGGKNAGRPVLLTGGGKWQQMSLSPMDMDFKVSMTEAKKLIAGVYGVPLPLVDTEATTFANMEAAKERFYIDTVIPLAEEFLQAFGNWLLSPYGDGLSLKIDKDEIPALESVRNRKFDRVLKALNAGLILPEEAREEIGYDPMDAELGSGGEAYGGA